MIRWDLDRSLILDANDKFLRMTGYTRDDVAAGRLNFRDMTPPEWTPRNEEGIRTIRAGGHAAPYEKEYFRKDGSRVPLIIAGTRFDDSPSEGMSLLIDISDRKRAEQEIVRLAAESERQRRLYETVLTNTPDFVYVFSLDHQVLYANDALIKMWGRGHDGCDREDVPGDRVRAVARGDARPGDRPGAGHAAADPGRGAVQRDERAAAVRLHLRARHRGRRRGRGGGRDDPRRDRAEGGRGAADVPGHAGRHVTPPLRPDRRAGRGQPGAGRAPGGEPGGLLRDPRRRVRDRAGLHRTAVRPLAGRYPVASFGPAQLAACTRTVAPSSRRTRTTAPDRHARRAGGVRGHPGAGPRRRAAGQGRPVRGRDDRPRRPTGGTGPGRRSP